MLPRYEVLQTKGNCHRSGQVLIFVRHGLLAEQLGMREGGVLGVEEAQESQVIFAGSRTVTETRHRK